MSAGLTRGEPRADCRSMAGALLFSEVLDERLAALQPGAPLRPPAIATGPYLAAPTLPPSIAAAAFARLAAMEAWPATCGVRDARRASQHRRMSPFGPGPSRGAPVSARAGGRCCFHLPALHLEPSARRALACLRELGAPDLPSRFTPAELRNAFRRLALRYHPDRHSRCGATERARLAGAFARVCEAYRALGASPGP
jgi:hypothetical protein